MSRVKQRVTIGCPRSPLVPCTVSETAGCEGARVCACAQLVLRYYTSIRHPPTRPRTFLLSNPQSYQNEWANMTKLVTPPPKKQLALLYLTIRVDCYADKTAVPCLF